MTEEEVTERKAMGERGHRRRQRPANWMDAMVHDVVLILRSNICRVGACCNIRYLMTDLDHVLRHQKYFAMDGYAERKNSPREKRKTDVRFCVFAPKFILQWPFDIHFVFLSIIYPKPLFRSLFSYVDFMKD